MLQKKGPAHAENSRIRVGHSYNLRNGGRNFRGNFRGKSQDRIELSFMSRKGAAATQGDSNTQNIVEMEMDVEDKN